MNDTDLLLANTRTSTSTLRAPIVLALALAMAACSGGGHGASQSDGAVSAALQSFEIVPGSVSVPAGTRLLFRATARYVDGSSREVTADSAWSASDETLLAFGTERGTAVAISQGSAQVTASYRGVTATAPVTITPGLLLALSLSPASPTLAKGTQQQLAAFAVLSSGKLDATTYAAWTTSNANVATVSSSGIVTARGIGTAKVTAAFADGIASAAIRVTSATLESITIELPVGASVPAGVDLPLIATGTFSDGSTQDLSDQLNWSSSNPGAGTVSPGGTVHGVAPGTTEITARSDGTSATVTIEVTSAVLQSVAVTSVQPTLAKGTSGSFTATGTFSDGSTRDLTLQANWSSSDETIAKANPGGIVQGVNLGDAVITAALASRSGGTSVSVTAAIIEAITISSSALLVEAGTTHQLTATATLSDGTTQDVTGQVGWLSSNDAVGTVSNAPETAGGFTAVQQGTVNVTATLNAVTGSAEITVTPATNGGGSNDTGGGTGGDTGGGTGGDTGGGTGGDTGDDGSGDHGGAPKGHIHCVGKGHDKGIGKGHANDAFTCVIR